MSTGEIVLSLCLLLFLLCTLGEALVDLWCPVADEEGAEMEPSITDSRD